MSADLTRPVWAFATKIYPPNPKAALRAILAEPKSDLARAMYASVSQLKALNR